MLRQINFGVADPLADLLLVTDLLIQVAQDLASLHNRHQTVLSLLRQINVLIIAAIHELLLDLRIGQTLQMLLHLWRQLRVNSRGQEAAHEESHEFFKHAFLFHK